MPRASGGRPKAGGVQAKPLLTQGASTLSTTDGKFANLYDNIFISNASSMKVNNVSVYNYPKHLGMTHEQGRANISDHAPVFLRAELGQGKGVAQVALARGGIQLLLCGGVDHPL